MRRMTQSATLDFSAIQAVTYNEAKRTLDVEFREGHSYRYLYVPEFALPRTGEGGVGGSVLEFH
jgi:hypothetical protein